MTSPLEDPRSPDRSTCRNCGQQIAWDDWSYVHLNGWFECYTTIYGGHELAPGLMLNPVVRTDVPAGKQATVAEPVEWNDP